MLTTLTRHELCKGLKLAGVCVVVNFQRRGGYTLLSQNPQKSKTYKKTYGSKAKEDDNVVTSQPRQVGGSGGQGGYIKRVTGDEREDEMDQNLG